MNEIIENINTKEDFADFISGMRSNFENAIEEWENKSIDRFLEAMENWVRSIDFYVKNTGDKEVATPSWKTFAKILAASKIYE